MNELPADQAHDISVSALPWLLRHYLSHQLLASTVTEIESENF